MSRFEQTSPRQRLVNHIQELERLEALKKDAAENLKAGFDAAKQDGYDTTTLKVVLKLRKMTPNQRQERRALEAIYLAALGMLEGDALPEEARRRLDGQSAPPAPHSPAPAPDEARATPTAREPQAEQPPLIVKDPAEARQEGEAAAAAGKRIYDNPYPAGDPCRAAWDEGWCAMKKSNGMETPDAYQRRSTKSPDAKSPDKGDAEGSESGASERGAA